jgi:hypothetical protein
VYFLDLTDVLAIVFILSYFGWLHAALWVLLAGSELTHGVLLKAEPTASLLPLLIPCMLASPIIDLLSPVFTTFFQWMLLMALVAFLGYSLAVYIHYLHTAAAPPRYGITSM